MIQSLRDYWQQSSDTFRRAWVEYVTRSVGDGVSGDTVSAAEERTQAWRRGRAPAGALSAPAAPPAPLTPDEVADAIADPHWPLPELSPRANNIIECRPYFGLPLGDAGLPGQSRAVADSIVKHLEKKPPITDLYVVSHGWHRNRFTGASAYDRLLARFALLRHRGVIETESDWNPLFVALHWNSDPGPSGFMDPQGRRHRQSFLDHIERQFDAGPDHAAFRNHFEAMFEVLARSCAVDAAPIDADLRQEATQLASTLRSYRLKDAPNALLAEKTAVLWMSYHEAQAKALLCDQQEEAKPTSGIGQAFLTLGRFVFGILGVSALIGFLPKLRVPLPNQDGAVAFARDFWQFFTHPLEPVPGWRLIEWPFWRDTGFLIMAAGVLLIPIVVLGLPVLVHSITGHRPKMGKVPLLKGAAWLVAQVLLTLPAIAFLLVTYLLRTWLMFVALAVALAGYPGAGIAIAAIALLEAAVAVRLRRPASSVFRERLLRPGKPGQEPRYWREYLVAIGRFPINWVKRSVAPDSFVVTAAKAIDNQLAFFEMQRKGVAVGDEAAASLLEIMERIANLQPIEDVRVHFVGHSFGGLVVQNAVRGLVERLSPDPTKHGMASVKNYGTREAQAGLPFELRSLCLIQSATASDWMAQEEGITSTVSGCIACLYSRYDTANGFWYPLANNGRMASGSVGLCAPPNVSKLSGDNFITLTRPPDLRLLARTNQTAPLRLNIDASRLIYEGAVATGGGHDDIFKDDVVNLVWSCLSA